jgi:hypothetical protein
VIEHVNLTTGEARPAPELEGFAEPLSREGAWLDDRHVLHSITAVGSSSGLVRVGRVDGGPPHLLAGHEGVVAGATVSPDQKWIASTGEDNTLRLWPMPDLSQPPLHTLPRDELIAKLKSLTNLRAVPDPEAEGGWKVELAPFPGWKEVPTW